MGFEKFSPYLIDFSVLNSNLSDPLEQEKYHQKWISRYNKVFKSGTDEEVIIWSIRLRRCMKEIFTSAAFYVEAKHVKNQNCFTSFYFLSYYSLFHGLLAVLCLDDNITKEYLLDIKHTKVINQFFNNFCNLKHPIIDTKIKEHFEQLKFMREYYSYTMPFNEFFQKHGFENPTNFLEKDILQCFQLAKLHSLMLEKSWSKNGGIAKITDKNLGFFYTWFHRILSKEHPFQADRYLIDDADKNAFNEAREVGCGIDCISIELEHYLDEFRTYQSSVCSSDPNQLNVLAIWNIVYKGCR